MIKLLIPDMPPAASILKYLERMDAEKIYCNFGPLNAELERRLSEEHFGGRPVVTVANATLGLEIVLGQHKGRFAVLPAFTFSATYTAARRAELLVPGSSFVDVDPDDWSMRVPASFADMPHAVFIPVCPFGAEPDPSAPYKAPSGPVVIDAAAAFGNYKPPTGVTAVYSMHGTKPFGCGEGGFVVCCDEDEAYRLRMLQNFGKPDDVCCYGSTNAKLSEYHAAVALAQLDRWEEVAESRRHLASLYFGHLASIDVILQHRPCDDIRGTMECLLPRGIFVPVVQERMRLAGIETRRWYWPPLRDGLLVTDDIADRLIGLPFHTSLEAEQIDYVCATLERIIEGEK